ncbi:MAG: hypothetical protein L6R42_009718, partial [Xanthoria sp. 1 TBL-2021]
SNYAWSRTSTTSRRNTSSEVFVKGIAQVSSQQIFAYQQIVGSLNSAAITTRPNIAHAASKFSEFHRNPSERHQIAATRLMQYLGYTEYFISVYDAQATDPEEIKHLLQSEIGSKLPRRD